LLIGRLSDRFGRAPAIVGTAFSLGALAIAAIGSSGQSGPLLLIVTFPAGILSVGAQMCTVVYCASFYPTSLRATGVGWVIGIGRIGSIVGPVLRGVLISADMPLGMLFLLVGALSFGSGAAAFALGRRSAASFGVPLPSQTS
jgi:AAHS family 4-hydroxybenzoate transporter-like MFS transporter